MSAKNKDDKNRWRNVTVAFRVSPEESQELDMRVKLCGARTKQDYLIESVLHQRITAIGNPLMLIQFRKQLRNIEMELLRIQAKDEMNEELLSPLRTMLEILRGFEETKENAPAGNKDIFR